MPQKSKPDLRKLKLLVQETQLIRALKVYPDHTVFLRARLLKVQEDLRKLQSTKDDHT